MNPLPKEPNKRSREEVDAEIEKMALEQNVKPFDPDEPFDGELWSDDEFEEFLVWLRESRRSSNRRKEKID
jgi:hypothetical protein